MVSSLPGLEKIHILLLLHNIIQNCMHQTNATELDVPYFLDNVDRLYRYSNPYSSGYLMPFQLVDLRLMGFNCFCLHHFENQRFKIHRIQTHCGVDRKTGMYTRKRQSSTRQKSATKPRINARFVSLALYLPIRGARAVFVRFGHVGSRYPAGRFFDMAPDAAPPARSELRRDTIDGNFKVA